jgi:hypothetical protein
MALCWDSALWHYAGTDNKNTRFLGPICNTYRTIDSASSSAKMHSLLRSNFTLMTVPSKVPVLYALPRLKEEQRYGRYAKKAIKHLSRFGNDRKKNTDT